MNEHTLTVPIAQRDAVLLHAALVGIHVTALRHNAAVSEVQVTFRTELSRAELEDFVLPLGLIPTPPTRED